jgi:hypothetical protein|eukprot:COSAG01_NODE_779_length_13670_cov_10.504974_3_plen_150_part_00
MRDAWISKLWRIQSKPLWNFFCFHKSKLANSGAQVNERSVWHGTSGLDPAEIYNDKQSGFMMQFSSQGFWGRGLYFAQKASYSHNYAYTPTMWELERGDNQGHEKEMFLAKLLGESIPTASPEEAAVLLHHYMLRLYTHNHWLRIHLTC